MNTIKFKKEWLEAYALITEPGKFALQVSNDVTENNLVSNEDGTGRRYIVGIKAIASDKLEQVKQVFNGVDEVDIDQTNGLFMTTNIWVRNGYEQLPVKGEFIDCNVDYVKSRDGEELVLRVVGSKVRPAKQAPKLDVDKFFTNTEIATPSTQESTIEHA